MKKSAKSRGKGTADPGELMTQKEAAEVRGVSQAAISDLIKRGRLKSVGVFGKVLVYRAEVEGFERGKPGPKGKG